MKLGIFGDSFASPSHLSTSNYDGFKRKGNFSWPVLLSKEFNFSHKNCHSQTGSSHWWSYEQFLKNYKKYDTIIFTHTEVTRWPHLPEGEIGHWNIGERGRSVEILETSLQRKINPHFIDIFSDELLNFISRNIYKSINELCLQNGIQLINIIPFEMSYQVEDYGYPVLTGLSTISKAEKATINNKHYTILELMPLVNELDFFRYCHLNVNNNNNLAKILKDVIINRKNGFIDLTSYDCWTTDDAELNAYYTNKLKKLS